MTTLIAVVSILLIGLGGLQLVSWYVHWPQHPFSWAGLLGVVVGLISLIAVEMRSTP